MLLELQNVILKMVARGVSLETTLEALCREVENLLPDAIVSVLTVDKAGRLHPAASPSLPVSYSQSLEGTKIGTKGGSCGAAAYYKKSIAVLDISTDPRWEQYKELALPHGLKACWSSPIFGTTSDVIGTLALYYKQSRQPTALEQSIIEGCLPLCMIVLEHHERREKERHLAFTDITTGLGNRAAFSNVSYMVTDAPLTLLLIDIDNLKVVNDTFGHAAGDDLIKTVAHRLAALNPKLEVYRLGGDEFAVCVRSISSKNLETILKQIFGTIVQPAPCHGSIISPSITIGVAKRTQHRQSTEELYRQADLALHHAKEISRGSFVLYEKSMSTAISQRREKIRMVVRAIRDNRVEAWYQPIIRLATQEIVGVEALARIRTEEGSVLSASQFHEATADVQAANALTSRMISLIARDLSIWSDEGIDIAHVGINVSAVDIREGTVSRFLQSSFTAHGVPLNKVVLELTESFFIGRKDERIAEEIETLRSMGVKVALDDFGTGFASLTHLLTVPLDIIKIDKSFVEHIGLDIAGDGIIEGVLHIAKGLRIDCIAEGVETREQAVRLQEMGCKLGQGFLYSQAVPAQVIVSSLKKSNWGQRVE